MALAYIGLRATSTTSVAIAGGKDASIATMKFTPDQYLARRAPYLLTADPDARASQTRGNLYALTCVQCSCRTGNRRTADPQLWYAPSYPSHWIARSSTGATPSRHANPFARRPNFEALQGQHGRRRDTDDEHKLRATRPSPKAQREVPRGSPRPLRAGWRRVWKNAERSRHARLRVPSEPDSCPSRVTRRSHPSVPPAAPPTPPLRARTARQMHFRASPKLVRLWVGLCLPHSACEHARNAPVPIRPRAVGPWCAVACDTGWQTASTRRTMDAAVGAYGGRALAGVEV